MQVLKIIRTPWLVACLAALLTVTTAVPVLADTASVQVIGGTISMITTVHPATNVTLDGQDQTTSYTIDVDLKDPTGTGLGWNVTLTSTTFNTGGGSPKSLSNSASKINSRPSASCVSGSTCLVATDVSVVSYPYTVPAGSSAPTATKMYSAAPLTGLGHMTFTPSVTISIPASTYAGTYDSTLTFAINSGP